MLSRLFVRVLARFQGEEGQDLIEYALVTALISVAIITAIALTPLGTAFNGWAQDIAAAVNPA
jgi:Flp pilus assembly pilin Flp